MAGLYVPDSFTRLKNEQLIQRRMCKAVRSRSHSNSSIALAFELESCQDGEYDHGYDSRAGSGCAPHTARRASDEPSGRSDP